MTSIDGRTRTRRMRARLLAATLIFASLVTAACGGGSVFGKVYEYEEDIYVSLDGSAEITVNASIPALVVLRGLNLTLDSAARLDPESIRALYESPVASVTRVSRPWRRYGRRFVQIRLSVPDIRQLSKSAPFAWSTYELAERSGEFVYKQTVGASAMRPGTMPNVGWKGGELVAFRLHLPSRITWHNARDLESNEPSDILRGNILVWEQHLTDRLDGRPIALEVRMDRQSILHRTLWLFAGAFAAAVIVIASLIWLTIRKGVAEPGD